SSTRQECLTRRFKSSQTPVTQPSGTTPPVSINDCARFARAFSCDSAKKLNHRRAQSFTEERHRGAVDRTLCFSLCTLCPLWLSFWASEKRKASSKAGLKLRYGHAQCLPLSFGGLSSRDGCCLASLGGSAGRASARGALR